MGKLTLERTVSLAGVEGLPGSCLIWFVKGREFAQTEVDNKGIPTLNERGVRPITQTFDAGQGYQPITGIADSLSSKDKKSPKYLAIVGNQQGVEGLNKRGYQTVQNGTIGQLPLTVISIP